MEKKAISRIKEYIDYKGLNNSLFEKENKLSNGYIATQLKRNADLGESILKKILDNCLDINPEWLLIGKGEMLKGSQQNLIASTNDIIDIGIGYRIKNLRISQDLKQKDIAELLEMDPSQYSKIENGKLLPTLLQVMQISKMLNESIDYIVSGKKSEKDPSAYQEINVALKDQIELLKENKKLLENEINTLKSNRTENKTYNPYASESKPKLEK